MAISDNIIVSLQKGIEDFRRSDVYIDIVKPRDKVLERFQPIFSYDNVENITGDEFRQFLLFENNHHWTGLHRQSTRICSNIPKLHKALLLLLNEDRPIESRLDKVVANNMILGMGKNIATAILLISQPDRYGVWNNRSEGRMKKIGIWPEFNYGESFGNRYLKVNEVFLELKESLQVDLWTLDAFWWFLDCQENDYDETNNEEKVIKNISSNGIQAFALERHLHQFLFDNWEHIELGQEWDIYREPDGEEVGYEYSCEVGRIDLLAKHKTEPKWLVIELKRGQTTDQTIGQLLRYTGWVKRHLAKNDHVQGMIIAHEMDKAFEYALSQVKDVEFRSYEVEFRLKKCQSLI